MLLLILNVKMVIAKITVKTYFAGYMCFALETMLYILKKSWFTFSSHFILIFYHMNLSSCLSFALKSIYTSSRHEQQASKQMYFKSNIHFLFSSVLVSINSWGKYLRIDLSC